MNSLWRKEDLAGKPAGYFPDGLGKQDLQIDAFARQGQVAMFVNLNAGPASRPRFLGELGNLSRAEITPNEFKYRRGTEIFGEGEPAEYVYQVIDGAVRSYKLLSDGRRQIGAFHLAGDIFGLENGGVHRFTAEAIVDTSVRLVKRVSLAQVAENDVTIARDLLKMTATNLQHAEDHMLLLGRKTSLERVAAFLLEMDRRLTAAGVMALPMCRRDIADYLGLTLETVSRALSILHDQGVLGFLGQTQRQIVLLDRPKLAEFDL
jgi:CRP/FNR family transcriptional regulator, nitrogen fixation regulation protein